jgi:tubulin polyglutamylase TTLL5
MTKRYFWLGNGTPSDQDTFFLDALDKKLWSAGSADQWDTCWHIGMPDSNVFDTLSPTQTINHIPGNSALTIKSSLYDTLEEASQRLQGTDEADRYDFYPETFLMPQDYFSYQEQAARHPDWLWIQKPKNLSRGRGIEVVKHPANVPHDDEWLIQRYLSDPHLYDGCKYVLRCYVLITSVEPLRFYWYQEGFCKLASEEYSMDDLDNVYQHLTNPDINEANSEKESPVTFYSFEQYREWLESLGHDSGKIFRQLKEVITLTVIAAREKIRHKYQSDEAIAPGCYELIGLDCMLDNDLKPWVLECNLSPSLSTYAVNDDGGDCETVIKRSLIKDLVNIMGLNHSEPITTLTSQERLQWEMENPGQFECLFPAENINDIVSCFPVPRYQDINTLPTNVAFIEKSIPISTNAACEHTFEDSLVIVPNNSNSAPIAPNDLASWIWLKNAEGITPTMIAEEILEISPCPCESTPAEFKEVLLSQIWDVLADWGQVGVFSGSFPRNEHVNDGVSESSSHSNNDGKNEIYYLANESCALEIHTSCPLVVNAISAMASTQIDNTYSTIVMTVIRSNKGYLFLKNQQFMAEHRKLSEILPTLFDALALYTAKTQGTICIHGALLKLDNQYSLVISRAKNTLDDETYLLSQQSNNVLLSASVVLQKNSCQLKTNCEPLFLTENIAKQYKHEAIGAVESYQTYATMLPMPANFDSYTVDQIIFVDNDVDSKTKITQAEALIALYDHVPNKSNSTATQLAHWLADVSVFKIPIN